MNYILIAVCFVAAFQASSADQDVKATLDQLQHAFEEMGKVVTQNVNTEEMKEVMVKKFEEMKDQMAHVTQDVDKFIKDNAETPVGKAAAKLQELYNEFKAKNPEVESNLQNFQQTASQAGEKFAQQMKEVYDKMNADGGLKDQVTNVMNDWGEKMKKTAGDLESKLKEMIQQSQH